MNLEDKPYIREIQLKRDKIENFDSYPFCIPAIKELESLEFHPDVTFFIGENGAGKSTLIEAIAVAQGFNPEGGTKNSLFSTSQTHSELHGQIKSIKSFKHPKDGYFLRAESFYNVATMMDETGYLQGYGGQSLHEQSHGESFMATLTNKLRGNGLYIMDEPEAALSPARQMAAISAIHQLVEKNSQFIIATHSPILLAYPRAKIYQFSDSGISEVAYEDTEHYKITKDFLNHHEKMMNILMET
ncbi:AAA family ATPase [Pseudoalteromonas citrea]|uniref:AAA family ATPase n=1 Tax=Pseudoalteromonas citrea TaxID=43655 RepID=A0A5S3XQR4_9GAMM|nr:MULTISPECIES: AAA family ATPase [Pseudoalteromonas]RJE73273.1 AAA family ATPase [Pseudoalteromonas sp. MSK9-3]TMP41992.1 AAA family ATPase [Pseudoalteromonas citrea]TMP59985.1 AAA family ATPase [Pseudoalteromonas citrea]